MMLRLRIRLHKWILERLAEEHLQLLAEVRTNRLDRDRTLARLDELERTASRRQTRRVLAELTSRRPLPDMKDVH